MASLRPPAGRPPAGADARRVRWAEDIPDAGPSGGPGDGELYPDSSSGTSFSAASADSAAAASRRRLGPGFTADPGPDFDPGFFRDGAYDMRAAAAAAAAEPSGPAMGSNSEAGEGEVSAPASQA